MMKSLQGLTLIDSNLRGPCTCILKGIAAYDSPCARVLGKVADESVVFVTVFSRLH